MDIPEDEVESVQNTRLTYFAIQRNVFKSKPATISAREFITGLLQFGITGVENGLKQKPELKEQWKRISESVYDKLNDIATGVCDSEDDRAAIARFKKPYKQLSDTEKETLEEDLDESIHSGCNNILSHNQSNRKFGLQNSGESMKLPPR